MDTVHFSWNDVRALIANMSTRITSQIDHGIIYLYPIPRGGYPIAMLLMSLNRRYQIADTPDRAGVIIDDLIDSGKTQRAYENAGFYFEAMLNKPYSQFKNRWVVFPWEVNDEKQGPTDAVIRLLQFIGESPDREGLKETPSRVIKSFEEIYGGYRQTPEEVMKVFEDGACDEMVIMKDIEFFSVCEHHMQPFFGKAHIAYLPNKKVIGASKLVRLLNVYARRLQIQERLTQQVSGALMEHLQPKGAACVIEATHFCMVCRGVRSHGSKMITSSLLGAFREGLPRAEFMSMING